MKQNRCQESENEKDKNYKLCHELMSDLSALLVEQQLIESGLSTLKRKEKNRTGNTVDDLVPLLIWICLVHHIQVLRLICLVQCQNKQTTLFSLTLFIRASLQHNCYCVRQREAKYNIAKCINHPGMYTVVSNNMYVTPVTSVTMRDCIQARARYCELQHCKKPCICKPMIQAALIKKEKGIHYVSSLYRTVFPDQAYQSQHAKRKLL